MWWKYFGSLFWVSIYTNNLWIFTKEEFSWISYVTGVMMGPKILIMLYCLVIYVLRSEDVRVQGRLGNWLQITEDSAWWRMPLVWISVYSRLMRLLLLLLQWLNLRIGWVFAGWNLWRHWWITKDLLLWWVFDVRENKGNWGKLREKIKKRNGIFGILSYPDGYCNQFKMRKVRAMKCIERA